MTLSAETMSARRGVAGTLDVVPTGAALGAEVRGIDLRNIEEGAFGDLMHAWHQHSVLLFRGQSLNDQELISFSRRFGDLDWAPIQENGTLRRRLAVNLHRLERQGERRGNRQPW